MVSIDAHYCSRSSSLSLKVSNVANILCIINDSFNSKLVNVD